MNFSMSARFDNAHQLTLVMDPETGELEIIWLNGDTSEVKNTSVRWDGDDDEGDA